MVRYSERCCPLIVIEIELARVVGKVNKAMLCERGTGCKKGGSKLMRTKATDTSLQLLKFNVGLEVWVFQVWHNAAKQAQH